jgi:hypothetical protein
MYITDGYDDGGRKWEDEMKAGRREEGMSGRRLDTEL